MARDEAESTEATSGGGGRGMLGLLIVAVVAGAIGAGGAFFALQMTGAGQPAPSAEAEAAAAAEAAEAAKPADLRERLQALDPFVVNVTGEGYPRYLKVKLELEAEDTATREELEARLPQIRDAIIVLLSSKRLADVSDFEGKALLKEEILERVNDLLENGRVRSVLFTEFVVQ